MRPSRIARVTDLTAPLRGEERRNRVVDSLNGMAIPADAKLVTDITIAAGASADVTNPLGRPVAGFVVSNPRTSAPLLYRTIRSAELEEAFLRLTHTGASATLFDLVIW